MATSEIVFTVDVDGETVRERFTTDDVNDRRAGYLPDVAESYAQHIAVDRHGTGIDVRTVDVKRLGEPHDQYDETGGTPAGGF